VTKSKTRPKRTPPRTPPKRRPTEVSSHRPPADTVGRLHCRRPSPPPDLSGLQAAIAALDAEHEYEGDMVVGFRDFKGAVAAAKLVRRCHALATGAELSELTREQVALLASVYERPYVRLRRVGRPRPSALPSLRQAIRDILAADIATPTRKVARRLVALGIVTDREGVVTYRGPDGEPHRVGPGAFANLVSQERIALRLATGSSPIPPRSL